MSGPSRKSLPAASVDSAAAAVGNLNIANGQGKKERNPRGRKPGLGVAF